MGVIKVSDRIYYLPAEKETDRPNIGYIRGDKFSLAVDAGNSKKHVHKFYNELSTLNLRLPEYTVITHWHWDHTFGMSAVNGKTIAGYLTNNKLKEVVDWKWTEKAMKMRLKTGQEIDMCDKCIRMEYSNRQSIQVVTANIAFGATLSIDLGELNCELYCVVAPHSEDSVLIYVPEEKTLFIGDADCGDYYNNDGNYDKEKVKPLLDLLHKLDFVTCILGHDEPQSKVEMLAYLESHIQ